MKRGKFVRNLLLIIILIGASFAGGFILEMTLMEQEVKEINSAHAIEVEALMSRIPATTPGYVLSKDLTAGSEITEADVIKVLINAEQIPPTIYTAPEDILGKRLKISAPIYTPVTEELLYAMEDISDDLREQQFSYVKLPDKLLAGDTVDIRIQFPTGQDYILLSKKLVTDMELVIDDNNNILKSTMWLNMDEKEIIRMGSATVDAYLANARLYAVEYIEPLLQTAAEVNYPQNSNVLEMIKNNPQIIDVAKFNLELGIRTQLDESLIQYTSADGQKISLPSQESLLIEEVVEVQPETSIETQTEANIETQTTEVNDNQSNNTENAADAFGD